MGRWRPDLSKNELLYEFNNNDGSIIKVRKGTKNNGITDILVTLTDKKVNDTFEKSIKHIYWVVDVLLKREHDPELIKDFLYFYINAWKTIKNFKSNSKKDIKDWIDEYFNKMDLKKYSSLNGYGFLSIESLHEILLMLTGNEKSAAEDTFMFKTIITRIADGDADLYDVIAWSDTNYADIKWENKK